MTQRPQPGPVGPAHTLDFPIVVHSHLRWDFVWQRPQQLLSRLSERKPVLFLEEPVFGDDVTQARLDLTTPHPGVHRAVPLLPTTLRDRYDDAIVVVRTLAQQAVGRGGPLAGKFTAPVQWFYTPMPAPAMLGAFGERGLVYDCMDELSQFRFAPAELTHRERFLLARADVVFTGGYRLYRSKSRYHHNVHFFGCGVDAAHFATARNPRTPLAPEIAALGDRRIMGYFGVVDERLDYELLRRLADAYPDVALVMVGPVVKVDPRELPRGENIHWLGQRPYAELPRYVKGFDVCLMPFALNEATEYINPTKTLEYMAAGKPIVSTRIADVVTNFTPIVRVADSIEEFVTAVGEALATPDAAMLERGIARAVEASWDGIVARMRALIAAAVSAPARRQAAAGTAWDEAASARESSAISPAGPLAAAGDELGA